MLHLDPIIYKTERKTWYFEYTYIMYDHYCHRRTYLSFIFSLKYNAWITRWNLNTIEQNMKLIFENSRQKYHMHNDSKNQRRSWLVYQEPKSRPPRVTPTFFSAPPHSSSTCSSLRHPHHFKTRIKYLELLWMKNFSSSIPSLSPDTFTLLILPHLLPPSTPSHHHKIPCRTQLHTRWDGWSWSS